MELTTIYNDPDMVNETTTGRPSSTSPAVIGLFVFILLLLCGCFFCCSHPIVFVYNANSGKETANGGKGKGKEGGQGEVQGAMSKQQVSTKTSIKGKRLKGQPSPTSVKQSVSGKNVNFKSFVKKTTSRKKTVSTRQLSPASGKVRKLADSSTNISTPIGITKSSNIKQNIRSTKSGPNQVKASRVNLSRTVTTTTSKKRGKVGGGGGRVRSRSRKSGTKVGTSAAKSSGGGGSAPKLDYTKIDQAIRKGAKILKTRSAAVSKVRQKSLTTDGGKSKKSKKA